MKQYETIPYREKNHGTFDEEWLPHKKASGWWYITGYFNDKENPNDLYTFQYTVAQGQVLGITAYILHMSLTDVQKGPHLFKQTVRLRKKKKIRANYDEVVYEPFTVFRKEQEYFDLKVNTEDFDLDLKMDKGKGAIWHCDDGVLAMGLPDDSQQRTVYYSYTNLLTEGTLVIKDKSNTSRTIEVVGKSWMDRQWGPFRLLDRRSHWEWFSLRFFDDEEIMLFSFPMQPYGDGTYVDKKAQTTRLQDFQIEPKKFIRAGPNNFIFSYGWNLIIPGIKEEKYEIKPLMEGQFNVAYFELIAEILNSKKERVGYCFVELICGARNELKISQQIGNLMKKS